MGLIGAMYGNTLPTPKNIVSVVVSPTSQLLSANDVLDCALVATALGEIDQSLFFFGNYSVINVPNNALDYYKPKKPNPSRLVLGIGFSFWKLLITSMQEFSILCLSTSIR